MRKKEEEKICQKQGKWEQEKKHKKILSEAR